MTPILKGIVASQISGHLGSPLVGSYDALGSVTLSASVDTISFAGIPSGYRHLEIRGIVRNAYNSTGVGASQYKIQFNGDTAANYSYHQLYANSSSSNAIAAAGANQNQFWGNAPWANAGNFGGALYTPFILTITDYASSTKNKTIKMLEGFEANAVSNNQYMAVRSGAWYSTSPITSILFDSTPGAYSDGQWASGTQIALYGVK